MKKILRYMLIVAAALGGTSAVWAIQPSAGSTPGVGDRTREGEELYTTLKDNKVMQGVSLIYGSMGENPALRFRTAFAGVTLAEYYRDVLEKDVLFFIDNDDALNLPFGISTDDVIVRR